MLYRGDRPAAHSVRLHVPQLRSAPDGDRPLTFAELRTEVVIVACAISAGIHGALVPDHFREGTGAGLGFVVATALLAVLAVALTRTPTQEWLAAAGAVLVGLIASYLLVVVTGFPVLHPEREPLDGMALFTKAVEVVGLIASASLLWRPSIAGAHIQPKGT
jgi:hypothetical protein